MLSEKFLTTLILTKDREENKQDEEKSEYSVLGLYLRVADQIKHLLDHLDTVKDCKDEDHTYERCKCSSSSFAKGEDVKEKEEGKEVEMVRWSHVDLVNHFKFQNHYYCSCLSVLSKTSEIIIYPENEEKDDDSSNDGGSNEDDEGEDEYDDEEEYSSEENEE